MSNRFPFDYPYEEFLKDKNEYDETLDHINLLNRYLQYELKFDKEYFDFLIRKNFQIVNSFQFYFQKSEKALIL